MNYYIFFSRFRYPSQGPVAGGGVQPVAGEGRWESGLRLRPARGRHLVVRFGNDYHRVEHILLYRFMCVSMF